MWKHPVTKKSYQIVNVSDGRQRTSPTLLKYLKEGRYDLLNNTGYVYNVETGRLFDKNVYFTRNNRLRVKYSREGLELGEQPNTIVRPKAVSFDKLHTGKDKANPAYLEGAAGYKRPVRTQQDTISKDLEAKIREMKDAGRAEIDGTPTQMLNALKDIYRPHVSYITKDGYYRAGGFLRKINEDEKWIVLAQPSKKISFSVDLENVKALYTKPFMTKVDPLVETTEEPTRYPISIAGVVIKYAKNSKQKAKFMATKRFKAMKEAYTKD